MTSFNSYANQESCSKVCGDPLLIKREIALSFEIRNLDTTPFNKKHLRQQSVTQEFYEIIWIKKGSGRFRIDMQTQEISDNTAVLLSPGQHYIFQPSSLLEGYSICFSQDFLCLTGRETMMPFITGQHTCPGIFPAFPLDKQTLQEFELIVLNMVKEYSNYFKSKSEVLQGLLKILMIYLSRKMDHSSCQITPALSGELIRKFVLLVDRNFWHMKMVSDYASELFVSPNHLNEIVKKNTGFTASFHIQQRIILEAKRLAINTEISMKEIAFQLGYEDIAHFSKFFKNNSGVSFTEFRKQLHNMDLPTEAVEN